MVSKIYCPFRASALILVVVTIKDPKVEKEEGSTSLDL